MINGGVMPGLIPGIHVFGACQQEMNGIETQLARVSHVEGNKSGISDLL
jgi:hypothetical protein